MSKSSIASQLAAIQKQRDLLSKKEAALRAESHEKVLIQIIKMAKDASLTLAEIAAAYADKNLNHQSHQINQVRLPVNSSLTP